MYKFTQQRKYDSQVNKARLPYLNKQTYRKKKISANRESVYKKSIQKEIRSGKHWQCLLKHCPTERKVLDVSLSSPDGIESHLFHGDECEE